MKKIIKAVGTRTDTIEERRKFTALKTSVQQEYVDKFRKIIQIAVKQFRIYKPHNPRIHHIPSKLPHKKQNYSTFNIESNNESKPLLTNNPFHDGYSNNTINNNNDYYQSSIFDENDDESKTLEENEEKMAYITEELTEMKDMFVDLDDIIRDQQDIVDLIETTVQDSKYDVISGAEHLIKAETNKKKLR